MSFQRTAVALAAATLTASALASSHREAPFITTQPKVDGTDFYLFNSYEAGRSGFVTLIANYLPLQDSYGGPNYFTMDPDALYEVHVDNNGDAREDLTFQFRFKNSFGQANIPSLGVSGGKVPVSDGKGGTLLVAAPLANIGGGKGSSTGALNVTESFTVNVVKGDRRTGLSQPVTAPQEAAPVTGVKAGDTTFAKPVDNIGNKSIPDYKGYSDQFIYTVNIPGCTGQAKLFVGQRHEGFVVNLGQVFDQVNLKPLDARNSAANTIGDKNITSLALEVPASCLTAGGDPVIGAWTTASVRQSRVQNPAPGGPVAANGKKGPQVAGGPWTQVSRLGSPLVNEVVIGITDKDKFNASQPKDDVANFGTYVLFPTLPVLVNVLFQVQPPTTPRNDLLAVFVTGVSGLTAPKTLTTPGEMLRLNTGVPATAAGAQSDLGFLGCDLAGFPNGRRPIDDVVDIELSAAEGAVGFLNSADKSPNPSKLQTCDLSGPKPQVVNAGRVVNDGAQPVASDYRTTFPYLDTPIPGAISAN